MCNKYIKDCYSEKGQYYEGERSQKTEDGKKKEDIWRKKRQCMSDSKPWKEKCMYYEH